MGKKLHYYTIACQLGASNDVKLLLKSKKSNCIALTAADGLIWAQVGFFFSAFGQTPPSLPAVRDSCSASPLVATACCNKHILELQADFQQQKSLVQEVIEAAGHLCIFLPKFHCELNFIEFFWGAVKKYLCDNCDYTFDTLKENMPKAMASVSLSTKYSAVGTSNASLDGSLPIGTRDQGCSVSGQKI